MTRIIDIHITITTTDIIIIRRITNITTIIGIITEIMITTNIIRREVRFGS